MNPFERTPAQAPTPEFTPDGKIEVDLGGGRKVRMTQEEFEAHRKTKERSEKVEKHQAQSEALREIIEDLKEKDQAA